VRILFVGDIVGSPGRRLVRELLADYVESREIEFIIANAENAAGGKGLTPSVARELFDSGIHVLTNGNHVWKHKEVLGLLESDPRVLRPANYPKGVGVPGRGSGLYTTASGVKVGVVNLLGRVFMHPYDCPFQVGRHEIDALRKETSIIVVDMHAEATSEKNAIGWYFDGEVSAVIGTHTHIPTADERISAQGTAYQTDTGMTGPYDSVIGVRKEPIIKALMQLMPARHQPAKGDLRLCGLVVDVDIITGKARHVERVCLRLPDADGETR
jgi:metallophosphoesterase (TIGR00282 family)